jgi:hypothetical protein
MFNLQESQERQRLIRVTFNEHSSFGHKECQVFLFFFHVLQEKIADREKALEVNFVPM